MSRRARSLLSVVALGALLGALSALIADRAAPAPSAVLAAGSEDAFAVAGFGEREFALDRRPRRWALEEVRFRFTNLPPGPLRLLARVHGHRGPVRAAAGGVVVTTLLEGRHRIDVPLPESRDGRLELTLHFTPFRAGDGRTLGGLPEEVVVSHAPARGLPRGSLLAGFVVAAVAVAAAAWSSGAGLAGSLLAVAATQLVHVVLLLPFGLVRSPYASEAAILWVCGAVVAAAFARLAHPPGGGQRTLALAAVLLAFMVQGLGGSWPAMVVSDVSFHAHNLIRVTQGQYWLTSRTQHDPPFLFPYGVSWYLLLAPLMRLGWDPGRIVQVAAGLCGVAGSLALYWLLRVRGAAAAALAVALAQFLPGVFRLYSYGNLSNVFGQAVSVAFLAWWASRRRPAVVGACLLGVAGLAHLSSLLVLMVVVPALLLVDAEARRDRQRLWVIGVGFALPALYYARFWTLVTEQLHRLGGSGPGASPLVASASLVGAALEGWGAPVIVLAVLGARARGSTGPEERVIRALWLAGAVLAVAALATPLETRFLYALVPAACASAAAGCGRAWRRSRWDRALVLALLVVQLAVGLHEIHESLLLRYKG